MGNQDQTRPLRPLDDPEVHAAMVEAERKGFHLNDATIRQHMQDPRFIAQSRFDEVMMTLDHILSHVCPDYERETP